MYARGQYIAPPFTMMDPYEIQTFLASQGGNMAIEFWTCPNCERTNAPGIRTCKCGAPKVEYVIKDETPVDARHVIKDDRLKQWAKKNAKIVRKIEVPDGVENFITSTLKDKDK